MEPEFPMALSKGHRPTGLAEPVEPPNIDLSLLSVTVTVAKVIGNFEFVRTSIE